MANDLFTKDDFVKKRKFSTPWYKNWKILTPSSLVLAGACAIGISQYNSNGGDDQAILPPDTMTTDSITKNISEIISDSMIVTKEADNSINDKDVKETSKKEEKPVVIESSNTDMSTTSNFDNVEKEALSVIRGNYGNNPDRRRLLKERYQEIQNKVNEMYRNGQVK